MEKVCIKDLQVELFVFPILEKLGKNLHCFDVNLLAAPQHRYYCPSHHKPLQTEPNDGIRRNVVIRVTFLVNKILSLFTSLRIKIGIILSSSGTDVEVTD